MCLGVPGQVVAVKGQIAKVDFWGTRKDVRLDALDQAVLPGDYVLDHAGFAVRVIPPKDVADTLAMYETILCDTCDDPISMDIVAELQEAEEFAEALS